MTAPTVTPARQRLGRVGVWLAPPLAGGAPVDVQHRALARIEELGYRSVWTGESPGGRDIFVQLGIWLAGTERLIVGSGIANIWSRAALTTYGASTTLVEAYPDRLVLGLGVGYPIQAQSVGQVYGAPLATMRGYLDAMTAAPGQSVLPVAAPGAPVPTVLAAVGPKMLALAAERADGAHPFAQPVANTARARQILGPDKLLIPEQAVAYDPDPARARETARAYKQASAAGARAAGISPTENAYARNLRRLGYAVEEIVELTDRVVDDTVAHGDEAVIADRVRQHLAAGADHVLVNPIAADLPTAVDHLARLAPAIVGVAG